MASFCRHAGTLALLLIIPGCADSSGPVDSRYGRYTLRTINGGDLPGLVAQNPSARLEFLSGALRLNRDNSFTDSTDLKVTPLPSGQIRFVTDVAAGIFRFSGDTVYFDSTRGEHYFMVFQVAGSLTQELGGSILVYRK